MHLLFYVELAVEAVRSVMAVAWADVPEPCSNHDLGPWALRPGPLAGNVPIHIPVQIKKQQQNVTETAHSYSGINMARQGKKHIAKGAKGVQSTVK